MSRMHALRGDAQKRRVAGVATAVAWGGSVWLVTSLAEEGLFRTAIARWSGTAFDWASRSVFLSVLASWPAMLLVGALGFCVGLACERGRRTLVGLAFLPPVACVAVMVQGVCPRATALLALPIVLSVQVASVVSGRRWRWAALAWLVFGVLSILPIDVTTLDLPGPPRFVPLATGLPSRRMIEAANRGELVLGGCVDTGFEPRWVWVW